VDRLIVRARRRVGRRLLAACLALAIAAPIPPSAALEDGAVIGAEASAGLRELFPSEIYEHYAGGEYRNRFLDLGRPGLRSPLHPPPFLAATAANKGQYAIGPAGSIVLAGSDRSPSFITGFPFPDVDATDADAARKIVWNFFYNNWFNGSSRFTSDVVLIGRSGVDRVIENETQFLFYQSAPEARDLPNPDELLSRSRTLVQRPADVNGIRIVSWRFRDPRKRDLNWTFVPALRRIRLSSPANRSDGFLGSDLAQDDGQYFAGKPEDFAWKLVGESEQLVLADEASFQGDVHVRPLAGGGWRIVFDDRPWLGYETPGWTGLPWAPTNAVLVKRPFWVVEGVPKDPYYLFGRLLFRFDKDTYRGYWASKHDWRGNLLASYQVQNGAYHTPDDGRHWFVAARTAFQTAENVKLGRATAIRFKRGGEAAADAKIPLAAGDFTPDWLVRSGK
jgi:hypothetical protein